MSLQANKPTSHQAEKPTSRRADVARSIPPFPCPPSSVWLANPCCSFISSSRWLVRVRRHAALAFWVFDCMRRKFCIPLPPRPQRADASYAARFSHAHFFNDQDEIGTLRIRGGGARSGPCGNKIGTRSGPDQDQTGSSGFVVLEAFEFRFFGILGFRVLRLDLDEMASSGSEGFRI